MKNLLSLVTALFAMLVFSAGCSDDTTTNPSGNPSTGSSMKATVDGNAWTATTVLAQKAGSQTTISGVAANGTSISIALGNITAPGDYTFGGSGQVTGIYTNGSTAFYTTGVANPGTLKITAMDATHVAGSFSFNGETLTGTKQTTAITSGTFNAKY